MSGAYRLKMRTRGGRRQRRAADQVRVDQGPPEHNLNILVDLLYCDLFSQANPWDFSRLGLF
jgi:hypothetical protein